MEDERNYYRERKNRINYLHPVNETGKAAREKNPEKVARENRNKEICLNCTKRKCSGTAECFRAERDKEND